MKLFALFSFLDNREVKAKFVFFFNNIYFNFDCILRCYFNFYNITDNFNCYRLC